MFHAADLGIPGSDVSLGSLVFWSQEEGPFPWNAVKAWVSFAQKPLTDSGPP